MQTLSKIYQLTRYTFDGEASYVISTSELIFLVVNDFNTDSIVTQTLVKSNLADLVS